MFETPVSVVESIAESVLEEKPINNEIVHDNQAVTTSLQVAETFGKEHKNVLRDIESLKKDMLNFEQMFYEAETPDSYGRPRRTFYMNRDGFTLLAMGFTGKKAMTFKIQYINQFNQMEEQLKAQAVVPSYVIDNPIERAKLWIEEQQEKMVLETKVQEQVAVIEEQAEVIEHKQSIIEGFAENVPAVEQRKRLLELIQ